MGMPGKQVIKLDTPAWVDAIKEYLDRRLSGGFLVIDSIANEGIDFSEIEITFTLGPQQNAKDQNKPTTSPSVPKLEPTAMMR